MANARRIFFSEQVKTPQCGEAFVHIQNASTFFATDPADVVET